jgi:hypothetical protein
MILKYKDFKQLNTHQMKEIFGGVVYSCSVSLKSGAPSSCNNYITTSDCSAGLSSCCAKMDYLANSDSLCFVHGSGNCYQR